jgi:hypothetical protein
MKKDFIGGSLHSLQLRLAAGVNKIICYRWVSLQTDPERISTLPPPIPPYQINAIVTEKMDFSLLSSEQVSISLPIFSIDIYS